LTCSLGPPDFYPPTSNCAEEILDKDSCQQGYKEQIDGIEVGNICQFMICILLVFGVQKGLVTMVSLPELLHFNGSNTVKVGQRICDCKQKQHCASV
jgi:hypothetical protein